MATLVTSDVIAEKLAKGDKNFSKMHLSGASFVGLDLRRADFRGASLPYTDFTDADCTYTNFESANLTGAKFVRTRCNRTNFKDACLSNSIMEASDLFGATFTLECRSFMGMKASPGWWYGWMMYLLLMKPPTQDAEDKVIMAMGAERYQLLRSQYTRRHF
jgi:hypothetical protein